MDVREFLCKEIFADPEFNCRGEIAAFDVIELIKSIELNGLQQPIVIQPYKGNPNYKYRVIMGHRRLKAYMVMGRTHIPASYRDDLTDIQARAMNLIENLERKDLNLIQEAKAITKFLVAGITQQETAKMIGKSQTWVYIRFLALKLDPLIQKEIEAGFINQEQIKEISNIVGKDKQFEVVRDIKDSKLRGQKRQINLAKPKTKKIDPFKRKHRLPQDMFNMQDRIRELIGNCLATRVLAWAAGEIATYDLEQSLKEESEKLGITYLTPLAS